MNNTSCACWKLRSCFSGWNEMIWALTRGNFRHHNTLNLISYISKINPFKRNTSHRLFLHPFILSPFPLRLCVKTRTWGQTCKWQRGKTLSASCLSSCLNYTRQVRTRTRPFNSTSDCSSQRFVRLDPDRVKRCIQRQSDVYLVGIFLLLFVSTAIFKSPDDSSIFYILVCVCF